MGSQIQQDELAVPLDADAQTTASFTAAPSPVPEQPAPERAHSLQIEDATRTTTPLDEMTVDELLSHSDFSGGQLGKDEQATIASLLGDLQESLMGAAYGTQPTHLSGLGEPDS